MKLAVTYPDAERATRDLLAELLTAQDETATVTVGVPADWDPETSSNHVQVEWDGTPDHDHPIAEYPTVRITAWAASTTEAKRVAHICQGLLCAHTGTGDLAGVTLLTGVQPARDPESRAELAWFTIRTKVRSTPIIPPS